MKSRLYPESETREWFDTMSVGPLALELPEPDADYAYAATRLFSWFPLINSKGATYFPEDFDDDLLTTLLGKQVNLEHDKSRVVGSIISFAKTDDGVDVAIRIDRDQAEIHGLDVQEMRTGNYFSHVSVELTKDPDESKFLAMDDQFNVKKTIPVRAGRESGIRRTTERDPFKLMGMRVAERIKPARFTGAGLVPRPADRSAEIYAVVANDETEERIKMSKEPYGDVHYADPGFRGGEKRYPLDTPEHVRAAASYFGMEKNRAKYTPEQRAHIDAQITAAKKRHGIGDEDKSKASADAANSERENAMSEAEAKALQDKVSDLESQIESLRTEKETAAAEAAKVEGLTTEIADLKAQIAAKETELASAVTERDALKSEKETAAREKAIGDIVSELEAILPCANDEERTALRETAAAACDDHGRIHVLKLERTVAAQEAKIAELSAAKPAEAAPAAEVTTEPPAAESKEGETASADEAEKFSANRPNVPIGPSYNGKGSKKYTAEELDAVA